VNRNVVGYYLDASGNRLQQSGRDIVISEMDFVPPAAQGVEAIVQSMAPSFFGGILGLDGLPIQADAAVVFQGDVCEQTCIAPIATLTMTFQTDDNGDGLPCYNIWDGSRQTGSSLADGADPCVGYCEASTGTCSNDPTMVCINNGGHLNDNACNFGACEDDVCKQRESVICAPTGNVCSNNPAVSCHNNDGCDYGICWNNQCTSNTSLFCSDNDDCSGTCDTPYTSVCSGDPLHACDSDADCPEGQYCEDDQGGHNSGLGWLNWSLQGNSHSCQSVGQSSDCSENCLEYNLTPQTCLSGLVSVGDWVAGASGVKNSHDIRTLLQCYANLEPGRSDPICTTPGAPVTVVVYDEWNGNGCNQNQDAAANKLAYHVVGFAEFKITGYELAHGNGSAAGYNGAGCEDWGTYGNRITGVFVGWVDGTPGDCVANGTISAPVMVK